MRRRAAIDAPALRMLAHAWLVTALNPKSLTFFVAFLPQFIDPHADFWAQMLIFETTFLVSRFRQRHRLWPGRFAGARGSCGSARAIGIFNRIGGTLLIGAGIAAASMRGSQ